MADDLLDLEHSWAQIDPFIEGPLNSNKQTRPRTFHLVIAASNGALSRYYVVFLDRARLSC